MFDLCDHRIKDEKYMISQLIKLLRKLSDLITQKKNRTDVKNSLASERSLQPGWQVQGMRSCPRPAATSGQTWSRSGRRAGGWCKSQYGPEDNFCSFGICKVQLNWCNFLIRISFLTQSQYQDVKKRHT